MAAISLKIQILDKEYQVNCQPEEREALEYSAQLLNEKMDEIRQGSHIIGLERIAVMAALNLAHDLIRSQTSSQQVAATDTWLSTARPRSEVSRRSRAQPASRGGRARRASSGPAAPTRPWRGASPCPRRRWTARPTSGAARSSGCRGRGRG